MLTIWIWLSALALLVEPGAAQSCRPELQGIVSNLARGRPAFQSSLYGATGAAGNAVDGNCNGQFIMGRSCTHTNPELRPWWYVDLGGQYAISAVVVKNREDCCAERLHEAEIYVGDTPPSHMPAQGKCNSNCGNSRKCGTITNTALGSICTIYCHGFKGRYVSIIIPNRNEYLTVCEVEVYGAKVCDQC